jgi:hypothetical protein
MEKVNDQAGNPLDVRKAFSDYLQNTYNDVRTSILSCDLHP